ncbi:MAG: pantetheine-phosphate adenylyltransferase [Flavobacteriales bacterium]
MPNQPKRIAVFPGSFDPFTKGHEDVVARLHPLFDEFIIAIGSNSAKTYRFSLEQRKAWISAVFQNQSNIKVIDYKGLTIDFCSKLGANYIVRGLRNSNDYEYEKSIAQMNAKLNPKIETILVNTSPEFASISSTIVRDILKNQGDASLFLPELISKDLN